MGFAVQNVGLAVPYVYIDSEECERGAALPSPAECTNLGH